MALRGRILGLEVRSWGFTLVELMITIVITAIALALAVPSWENLVQKRQVTSAAEEIASFLMHSQSQAIKSNQQVTVTVKRNAGGTSWCVGAMDEEARDDNGGDPCECDLADDTEDITARCTIEGEVARIWDFNFEKFTMAGSGVEGVENLDFYFNFDPVRGLKIEDDGISVDGDNHAVTLATNNENWALQVEVTVTGRVNICNPDSSKKVPGFDLCDG
jgi:prepilin-type N-terminal cleavage/methylation domain-containing protein